ncbi:MAG: type 4a pilus biogenesis protein PilO [Candidatus Doudnabacteria bacterium]|nr:type 4a pilus biogenesis protein PilO [Candidatus Doudnabacteria bacterium]
MAPELPKSFSKLQLPPINKQNQTSLVEIVLLVVIVVLFYWFVITPKKAELADEKERLDVLKIEQSSIDSQKRDLERFIRTMKTDPASLTKLDEALPLDGKVMILHLLVEKLASEAGIVLDNVTFNGGGDSVASGNREFIKNPYSEKRTLKKILGNVNVKGQFSQIQSFLEKLEESGRIFDISDFQINATPEGEISMSAGLTTYYFAP